jgi:hypothetical protein
VVVVTGTSAPGQKTHVWMAPGLQEKSWRLA